ncbi:MAG: ATP-binding cassette domain-containing protein [Acetobacter sp.]|uniref:ATP-binding cassette domain-containing protein n=1 Tax=Acetobacter sp. TaxID=440 RepID=UPI0039E7E5F9
MTLELRHTSWKAAKQVVLDTVSVTFERGAVTAIVGPNGAGKSTLLRIASGLLPPSGGDILLDGTPLGTMAPARLAAHRAMLAQENAGEARFTVRELVAMGATVSAPNLGRTGLDALVQAILARLGLQALAERDVMSLSGGERQRAHLARVLIQLEAAATDGPPGFLLLDEPLSAQDPAHQRQVLHVARDFARRGGGVVLVVHDLNWASAVSDTLVVMHKGTIHAAGAPGVVFNGQLARTVFGLPEACVGFHPATGRPYCLPHDTFDDGAMQCTSP